MLDALGDVKRCCAVATSEKCMVFADRRARKSTSQSETEADVRTLCVKGGCWPFG